MNKIDRRQEYQALLREPQRNAEVIRGKVRNLIEPITEVLKSIQKHGDLRKVVQEARKDREYRQELEQQVIQALAELTQTLTEKATQINESFTPDGFKHKLLEHMDLHNYLAEGWELYAGEIPMEQVEAAVTMGSQKVPVVDEQGMETGQEGTVTDPELINAELSQMQGRDNVYEMDFFPNAQEGDVRVNFHSPQTGSELQERGTISNQSTSIRMDLEPELTPKSVVIDLDHYREYNRRSTVSHSMSMVHIFKTPEKKLSVQYVNVRPTERSKSAALKEALMKLKWMKYAVENAGKEYFARANLASSLPAEDGSRRSQTAGSLFLNADSESLQRKQERNQPRSNYEPGSGIFDF